MIAAILAIAIAAGAGAAIVLALDPHARGARLVSLAFPVGIGACALSLGALSAAGVAWSRASVLVVTALVAGIAAAAAASRRRALAREERQQAAAHGMRRSPVAWAAAALLAVMLAGHAMFATLAPPGEWDFWAIWGLKGRVFHEAASIDWAWLERPANDFAHPDYPILLPLAYDYVAAIAGRWPEREMGLLFSAFAAAILLFTASRLRDATGSSWIAAAGTLALAGPVLSLPIGLADLPLLAFGTIALLELRSAMGAGRGEERTAIAALALALAAMTKNEGISLVVATAIAILIAGGSKRWRLLLAIGPAALAAASWIALRTVHGLGTDLFRGDPADRLAAASLGRMWRALADNPPTHAVFWLALLAAIVLGGARRLARERFVLVAIAIQTAFFLGAYLVTPHDLAWHVETSWPRLLGQVVAPLAFVATLFAGEVILKPDDRPMPRDA